MAVFGEGVEEAALCSYCVGGREETDPDSVVGGVVEEGRQAPQS